MSEFHFIRGKRIVDQIENEDQQSVVLDETTAIQLQNNIKQLNTKRRQFSTDAVQVRQISMIPAIPSNILEIKAPVVSDGNKYDVSIQFLDVNFEDIETFGNVTFTGADSETYHVEKIKLSNINVKVRCSCLDFYHRFAPYNATDGSLSGKKPMPYTPITDRASDNPKKLPGVCKHIIKTLESLKRAGMVS